MWRRTVLFGGALVGTLWAQHTFALPDNEAGVQWSGLSWLYNSEPSRVFVNAEGDLEWDPEGGGLIITRIAEQRLSQPGDVVEVSHVWMTDGDHDCRDCFRCPGCFDDDITCVAGTSDMRVGLFQSDGVYPGADGFRTDFDGYRGYDIRFGPNMLSGPNRWVDCTGEVHKTGNFAKKPVDSSSILRTNDGFFGDYIDGFRLPPGESSLFRLRLERLSSDRVRVSLTLNGRTQSETDRSSSGQPRKIDIFAISMRNSRPYSRLVLSPPESAKACRATRDLPGAYLDETDEAVRVRLRVTKIAGPTTVSDTFPAAWAVADHGGGHVEGNTITFTPAEDAVLVYRLAATGPCETASFSGTIVGPDGCEGNIRGESAIECSPTGEATPILGEGAEIRFFRGTTAPPEGWHAVDFDDSAWEAGKLGIGYGDGDDRTILDDMRNRYAAVFGRATFDPTLHDIRTQEVRKLELRVRFDDGFMVFLGGEEIARPNLPGGNVSERTLATSTVGDAPRGCEVDDRDEGCAIITIPVRHLQGGKNVLAFSAHNTDLESSDLSFIPALLAYKPREEPPQSFRRGDADGNGALQLTDAVWVLTFLFLGGHPPACPDAADTDDSGGVNISDAILVLRALFQGKEYRVPPPGFDCGVDPTEDALGNCSTPGC